MTDGNKRLLETWVACMNRRDFDGLRAMSDDQRIVGSAVDVMQAFPDGVFTPLWVIEEGDLVCMFQAFEGTHGGPFFHLAEGTGRRVKAGMMVAMRVRDGKFVDMWLGTNPLAILQQLEAVELVAPRGETSP